MPPRHHPRRRAAKGREVGWRHSTRAAGAKLLWGHACVSQSRGYDTGWWVRRFCSDEAAGHGSARPYLLGLPWVETFQGEVPREIQRDGGPVGDPLLPRRRCAEGSVTAQMRARSIGSTRERLDERGKVTYAGGGIPLASHWHSSFCSSLGACIHNCAASFLFAAAT